MQDRRRAEIEAKRARLEEMRRVRAERQERQVAESAGKTSASSISARTSSTRQDVDNLIDSLLGNGTAAAGGTSSQSLAGDRSPSVPGTPYTSRTPLTSALVGSSSGGPGSERPTSRTSQSSGALGVAGVSLITSAAVETTLDGRTSKSSSPIPLSSAAPFPQQTPQELYSAQIELYDLPQVPPVTYTKSVQTTTAATADSDDDDDNGPRGSVGTSTLTELQEEALRKKILLELEDGRKMNEGSGNGESISKTSEEEVKDLTPEQRQAIYSAPDFLEFVELSSKIVQRALSDGYDYIRDYSNVGGSNGLDENEGNRVKLVCTFSDENITKGRSVTDVDWSPKFPELSAASYSKNLAGNANAPDGLVAVWNMHLLDRPEFVFHSQTDVLSLSFSPFHSNLLFGGTYSGQILLWDTRSKHLPVLKTPLSASGHTYPVYSMKTVGTKNAHNLVSGSTDGFVCSWLSDMLAQPQETLPLTHTAHNRTDEVSITTLDFPDNETTTFWVGTEEGNVYQANRYDRAGSKAGLNQYEIYKSHSGPVTGLHFHPLVGPIDFSDLFLTSSVDWTVKLWKTGRTATGSSNSAEPSTPGAKLTSNSHSSISAAAPKIISPLISFEEASDYVYDVKWHPTHPAMFGTADGSGKFDLWNLNSDTEVPLVSTQVTSSKALNKLAWDRKDGRRAALGSSDGKLYIYDIGDMAMPRESEWSQLQRTLAGQGPSAP